MVITIASKELEGVVETDPVHMSFFIFLKYIYTYNTLIKNTTKMLRLPY